MGAPPRIKTIESLLKDTIGDWLDDRAMSLAASLAFYTVLSLAPLLIVAVSVAGLVFGEAAARGEITQQLRSMLGQEGGAAIEGILAHAKEPHANVLGTAIGLVCCSSEPRASSASFRTRSTPSGR
jgi:membrane protein